MKPILIFSLVSLFLVNLHAVKRHPLLYDKALSEKEDPYIFSMQPLFSNKDKVLAGEHKILNFYTSGDRRRLYLWTTPVDISDESEDNEVFEPSTTLPYPMYSTFSSDPFFDSPLTALLSPPRKALYDLQQYGFTTKIIGLYIGQTTENTLPNGDRKAGFLGFEAYSNWLIYSSDMGLSALTFELGYQSNLHKTEDLSKSVGSIITSNVILGDSGPIIGDIYYTQGFFDNKVLVHAGRLTPWYFYGYNTFTDSETDAFTSEMFSGSVALPQGGGNGSKPGVSIQYFINEKFYWTSVLTNTEGKASEFDFSIFNKDAYFIGTEIGYLSKENALNTRISLGVHRAKVKQKSGERKTGNGFNLMLEQELTPRDMSPYAGFFLQYEYSPAEIAPATQQISGGIDITHPFHRKGDSFGWGIGTVKPSDEKLRREYFSDTYYRLQFTENLQWSFDLQLYIHPSSSENNLAPVFNTRILFSF